MRSRLPTSLALAVIAAGAGMAASCTPSFTPFRFIEKPRVIGGTVAVAGDPTRVTPAPGETATLTLLTADVGPRLGRTYALIVCRPAVSNLDVVFCSDPAAFVAIASEAALPGKVQPEITFTVPDAAMLGDADELWVQGAVCNGGTVRDLLTDPPVFDEPWDPCMPDPAADPQPVGQLLTSRIPLERTANDRNHRPRLTAVELDGKPFEYTAGPGDLATGCAGMAGVPQLVNDGYAHRITSRSSLGSRESYVPELEEEPRNEEIFMRLFFTAGSTNGSYGVIGDDSSAAELAWSAPAVVDPTGTLVRFYGMLIDERDAQTPFERAFCLVPGP